VEVDDYLLLRGVWLHPEVFRRLPGGGPARDPLALRLADAEQGRNPLAPRLVRRDPGLFRTLQELFEQTQAEYARGDAWRDDCLRVIASLTAFAFLRLYRAGAEEGRGGGPAATVAPTDDRVRHVRAWIDRNYLEPASLARLAEMASLSPSQFSEVFRRVADGTPPMAYLRNRRLEHAAALLTTGDMTVAQVAAMSGFENLAHFTELFKRHRGQPPAEYRKNAETGPRKP
jgi:AraC-like DNA-binding protein